MTAAMLWLAIPAAFCAAILMAAYLFPRARAMSGTASQSARVLALLSDGKPHSHHEIYALGCVGHSCIDELAAARSSDLAGRSRREAVRLPTRYE